MNAPTTADRTRETLTSGDTLLQAARSMVQAGFSVIPCDEEKKASIHWKQYQKRPMTDEEIAQYFTRAKRIATVCGSISGNLEVLDFDDPTTYTPFLELVESQQLGLTVKLPKRQTPSGGYHLVYRCVNPTQGNLKLACNKDHSVRIETRGEGGYALAPPSRGYSVLEHSLLKCPTLTAEEVSILHSAAKAFDLREQANTASPVYNNSGNDRPGDQFNKDNSLPELLLKYGWREDRKTSSGMGYTRPGKDKGTSGVLLEETGNFYCWSSNAHPLEPQTSYNAFALFSSYEHGGDYSAAARGIRPQQAKTMQGQATHISTEIPAESEQWEKPEPLPDDLLPVEPFDYDLLPNSLRAWVKDICNRLQCPPDFVAVGIMIALAAVVGRKIGIGPQKNTDWIVIPNLWGLIVGRPSIMKSPALEAALGPLKKLIANATALYNEAYVAYKKELIINKLREGDGEKKAKEALKKDSHADISKLVVIDGLEEPQPRRYMTNDSSPAALGELLRRNPNGALVYRDELVSLIKDLDKEENAGGRGFYLTGWNGDSSYTSDRIGRGMNLYIEAICLSVLGGTQPGKIERYISQAVDGGESDDGLIQRFSLMVWPDNPGDWINVDRWPDNDAKKEAFRAFDYLDKLDPLDIGAFQNTDVDGQPESVPYLRYDDNALELFNEWRQELERRLRDDSLPPYLESHFGKYRKLIPALSLLIHLCEGGSGPVTEDPTLKALAWGEYLESHARRIYSAGTNGEAKTAKTILKKIMDGSLKDGFCSAAVYRPKWSMLTDRGKVQDGLTMLVDYGYLQISINEDTGGRKSTTYKINPECFV